jgi:hypothetical protein
VKAKAFLHSGGEHRRNPKRSSSRRARFFLPMNWIARIGRRRENDLIHHESSSTGAQRGKRGSEPGAIRGRQCAGINQRDARRRRLKATLSATRVAVRLPKLAYVSPKTPSEFPIPIRWRRARTGVSIRKPASRAATKIHRTIARKSQPTPSHLGEVARNRNAGDSECC